MHLGILVTSGVGSEDAYTAGQIAAAARRRGHKVSIFLMDDGVHHARSLASLAGPGGAAEGSEVALCAHNGTQRGVPEETGILWGSQFDWARIVAEADRILVLG